MTALAAVTAASGADGNNMQRQLTPSGQAIARAGVIHKSDLGPTWIGSIKKVDDVDSETPCPGYKPKVSDLTLIGSASSDWQKSSAHMAFTSEAQVMKSPAMARLDWNRTFGPRAKFEACLRISIGKNFKLKPDQIEIGVLPFPPFRAAIRAKADVLSYGLSFVSKPNQVPVFLSMVFIRDGRAETTLLAAAPYSIKTALVAQQMANVSFILGRLQAAGA